MNNLTEIENIKKQASDSISSAQSLKELEDMRVSYLGKKGKVTTVLKSLGSLYKEERPLIGQAINKVKSEIELKLKSQSEIILKEEAGKLAKKAEIDITLPGKLSRRGGRHILSRLIEEIIDIFIPLGYRVAEGPEVELDYYNFTALNTPPGHPARSLQDTFYIETNKKDSEQVLLRTHTSPVQIRVMKEQKPPVYIVCPGKAFRRDVVDATHSPIFHQIEGLAVDEKITFGDLKGTLERFAKGIFGEDRAIRLRPHFFPFTEPSAEVDVSCILCAGEGCRVCKYTGWLEILGAGMVDPNVLKEVGYDPEKVSGFAFGMGVERIAMLKYGITDIRLFYENDMRFLKQL